ncbi:hypothetical protein [Erythrobacter sp. JK5]|uniref:hypothetical protein n=1 Tax=Erythrobacter sp. JK5 TaxID=2829500 RepID=UPI001BA9A5A4|nr:hypothetical protein [Erythrobacter sp. JK5]QUL36823.1 hypothetical protein KDC96_10385 [Erythrobacter sp. JK5]
MADKPENKAGKDKSQDKSVISTQKTELRDSGKGTRPLTEQKVTSNLKPPTRPNKK